MSEVYFRGKGKSRAQLLKEDIARREAVSENVIDLYPENDTSMQDNAYIRKMLRESESKKSMSNYSAFQENVMKELFFQTMYTNLVEPVLNEAYANDHHKEVAARTIIDFINEQDVYDMLSQWKYKNQILAEYAQAIDKTYKLITETAKDKLKEGLTQSDAFQIENNKIDDYIMDTKDIIPPDISKTIVDRVEDSINDFVADNKINKMKIMQIYDKAKDQIAAAEGNSEIQESYLSIAKKKEKAILESDTNVFGAMTKILTESVMKIRSLKESYCDEKGKVDFSKVIGDARSIYTCLEALNTVGIVDATPEYIANTLKGMRDNMETISNDEKLTPDGDQSKQPKEVTHDDGSGNNDNPADDFVGKTNDF